MKKRMVKIYVKEDYYKRIFNLLPLYKSFSKYFDKVITNDLEFRDLLNKAIKDIYKKDK